MAYQLSWRTDGLKPGEDVRDAEHPINKARKDFGLAGEKGKPPGATPAPEKPYDPRTGGYERTWGRDPAQSGSNCFAGASSLPPGARQKEVALAQSPQPDSTREHVISKSQKLIEHEGSTVDNQMTNSQTRDIRENRGSQPRERVVPSHPHMSGARSGPKVPSATGYSESQPVRKPGTL
jgi:hypothetical protein